MYIKVTVIADAREEIIRKTGHDSYDISVKEKAERNLANSRVIELIRNEFGNKARGIRIISGHHSSNKILSVDID